MDKTKVRQRAFRYLTLYGNNMKAKFSNICSKTGSYDVPLELFQKRTPRKNRALISWQAVKNSQLTMEQLNSFEGGIVVNFINNDYFDEINKSNTLFQELCNRIGSNENVSSIISIQSESGSSSSAVQREAFRKLINNTKINYRGEEVVITESNYSRYAIKQDIRGKGKGNETWSGFLFISIRGGQQDTIQTHAGKEMTLFNPACEYASEDVCEDINLVMAYFALMSIQKDEIKAPLEYKVLLDDIELILEKTEYDFPKYSGNLLDYVKNHYSIALREGQLTDPIQLSPISIKNFNISERTEDSIDFTHGEAVIYERYYWDNIKNSVISPARPTNVFWSYHLSNMMQQNYSLDDYFDYEEKRFEERKRLMYDGKNKK